AGCYILCRGAKAVTPIKWARKRDVRPRANHKPKPKGTMPLINVQIIENVFTPEQKKQIITRVTDAMVAIEGEALRDVTWVKIDEDKEGTGGIGGQSLHARDAHRMKNAGA